MKFSELLPDKEPIAIITPYWNPCKYKSRYENYLIAKSFFRKDSGKPTGDFVVPYYTVALLLDVGPLTEVPFNDPFDRYICHYIGPEHFDDQFIWQKEKLINHALKELHSLYEVLVWIDADAIFVTEDMAGLFKRIHAQCTPENPLMQCFESMATSFTDKGSVERRAAATFSNNMSVNGVPGLCWAVHTSLLEKLYAAGLNLLYDKAILGGGDSLFYRALTFSNPNIYKVDDTPDQISSSFNHAPLKKDWWNYFEKVKPFFEKVFAQYLKDSIMISLSHGSIVNRKYGTRYDHWPVEFRDEYLVNHKGYWGFSDSAPFDFRMICKKYFLMRDEDDDTRRFK